ncbi:FIST N-terminal domain-containing protein [Acerihabitans sp. TG2]|uniref:FIST N-terminal domain-containing protein n=1 Tax=Acerihabitans sp. TG2 TaxID=3096008 RepID=UPI002B23B94E|nr:FIST N-terminal domain-containing protein [Acerihabitans sp. TG2]MEA9389877.1 FIST N-terminal domain-containing protein [Acerihabitans sp. TG2]
MNIQPKYASSESPNPVQAVAEFASQIGHEGIDTVIFFCSPDYDLDVLGRELKNAFSCPCIGCTSSGQIGTEGFQHSGLLGLGLGENFRTRAFMIHPLLNHTAVVADIAEAIRHDSEVRPNLQRFGLLLVDGLSMAEERLVANLYQQIGNVPIIGGSAGDDLRFEKTYVYDGNGQFISDAAIFAVVETHSPITTFKVQHFEAGGVELVITEADPEKRLILEINGEPAAQVYAQALGLTVDELTPTVFSRNPLVLSFGDEPYVRSILKWNEDFSLTCYCAIEEGLIVAIGKAKDPVRTLEQAFAKVHETIPEPAVIIGCDCILRRIQFEQEGLEQQIGGIMKHNRVVGFSTYGEQYNGLHVNQTFTGVAIGGPRIA